MKTLGNRLQPKFSQCQNPIVEGLMGRPLKPQKLHVLHGTNRKDRDTKREGELMLAAGDVGECPAWFRPVSREEWARITGDQQYRQILAPAHRGLLIEYCTPVSYTHLRAHETGRNLVCR